MTDDEKNALERVVRYLEHRERAHYEASSPEDREGHIYESVQVLRAYLNRP